MNLPNAESAFIDLNKLQTYSLNLQHDRGKHKARLFLAILGLNADDAEILQTLIRTAILTFSPAHELLHPEVMLMNSTITQFQVLDVIALKDSLPDHHLRAGQVGTLVEQLAPEIYEVEFSDDNGQTYALLPLHTSQLLKLYYTAVLSPEPQQV